MKDSLDNAFFDYGCDACGNAFCERVNVMNLALGNVDEAFCLSCLAQQNGRSPQAMADFCWEYVKERDCFKDPWLKFNASACPKRETQECHCQHA